MEPCKFVLYRLTWWTQAGAVGLCSNSMATNVQCVTQISTHKHTNRQPRHNLIPPPLTTRQYIHSNACMLLCSCPAGQRPQPVQQPVPQRPVQQPAGPRGQVQVPRPAAAPATPVLQPVITRPAPVVTRPAPVPLPVPAARPNAPTPSGAVSLVPPSVQAQGEQQEQQHW